MSSVWDSVNVRRETPRGNPHAFFAATRALFSLWMVVVAWSVDTSHPELLKAMTGAHLLVSLIAVRSGRSETGSHPHAWLLWFDTLVLVVSARLAWPHLPLVATGAVVPVVAVLHAQGRWQALLLAALAVAAFALTT